LAAAQAQLLALGALDQAGRITPHGHAMATLPMDPPLAHMVLYAAQHGAAICAARLALLLQERGLGGRSDDLAVRLDRWGGERGTRAEASRKLADRWARAAEQASGKPHDREAPPLAVLMAEAFPDRIAKSRSASGEDWLSAGGRGYRLDPASPLARATWLVIGDAQGQASGARILAGLALNEADVTRWLGHRITARQTLAWNTDASRVDARLERQLGAITLARVPDPSPDPAAVAALLLGRVRADGLRALPLGQSAKALLARGVYAGLAPLEEATLLADLGQWLRPLLAGRRDLAIPPGALHDALFDRLDWSERQHLETLAPAQFSSPLGTSHPIDYVHDGGPAVELRVQALFGLDRHPVIGRPPRALLLSLTSPGGRPIQLTTDLPAFWRGSWRDVVKDMKGRYPRHRWPDEPWLEDPSLKTRNAFERTQNRT
jgi:ATP-dependent helicase HrpB